MLVGPASLTELHYSRLGDKGSGVVEEPEAEAYLASLEASPTLSKGATPGTAASSGRWLRCT